MKKRSILMLIIVMCIFVVACGKEETEENPMDATGKDVIEETIVNENITAAQEIITLTETFNTIDNIYTEEIGYAKCKDFFMEEQDEEAYQLILADLEEKTGSAQKQVEKFYENIDILFTENCTTVVNQWDSDAVLFHYYYYLTRDYQKAYDWVISGAIGGGVNVHSEQEGAAWSAGGDWIYYGEMTMYLPYYIYENLYTDKAISIEDMVNEIGFMDRSISCLANMDYDTAYDNWDWSAYEYNAVRDKIPLLEAMMWMGREYETFEGLSEHELIFSPSIVTQEDYWDYDWYDGTVTCAYVIHFYDKTADLYGEAGFTADNKIMGLSFWEETETVSENADQVEEENVNETSQESASNDVEEKNSEADKEESTNNVTVVTESVQVENNEDSVVSNTTSSTTNTSGGIVFEHHHTWETITEKVSDAYIYQELVQQGYNCGVCNTVFGEYASVCPSCASECINNNYVLEDRQAPAVYTEYDLCRFCGSTANYHLVEK